LKLLTLKQFQRKSKESLIRYITKHLRKKSRKTLASLAYHMTKAKLPRLKTIQQKQLTKKKSKEKKKKPRTAKQRRADKAGARRLKAWNKANR